MNKSLQIYLQTLTLVCHADCKNSLMFNLITKFTFLMDPIRALTYFSTIGKKFNWLGTKHRGYGFTERIFIWWILTSMHVHLRILRIYFLHITYLFLFYKNWSGNIMNFSQKIYTLNSKNVAQKFVGLAQHFLPATICFDEREIFLTQST